MSRKANVNYFIRHVLYTETL